MKKITPVSIALLLIMLLPLVGACVTQETPPVEGPKGEIVIGILEDLSGPLGGIFMEQTTGELDCIRYINEERGGVLGHPLKAIVIDHRMNSDLVTSGWNELKAAGVPVVISASATIARALQIACEEDRIPVVSGGGSMDQLFPRESSYYFCTSREYFCMFENICKHIESDWAKSGKAGKPKIGFNFMAIGKYPTVYGKAAELAAEKRGWDITMTETSMEPDDVSEQVVQMKEFGIDYLYLMATENAAVAWLREMDRQKLYPTIYSVNGLSSRGAWDAVGELMVGSRLDHLIFQWTETDIPLVRLCHELNAKWHPGFEWRPGHYFRGFLVCLAVAEALERAITRVGYDNLDGSAMKEAMETIRDFKPEGTDVPFTWTPTDHQGLPTAVWYEWTEEGIQVPISERFGCDSLPEEMRTEAWWLE